MSKSALSGLARMLDRLSEMLVSLVGQPQEPRLVPIVARRRRG